MSLTEFFKCLILSLVLSPVLGCSNSVPSVQSLVSVITPEESRNGANFTQISASSQKSMTTNNLYRGTLRVGQPLGQLNATSSGGYRLKGTVSLQK